jgi:uncharacterized protein YidB (DUF937 family)
MGLLDDLLGQLAGGAPQRPAAPTNTQQTTQPSGGPGMGAVMAALLPVVLAMLQSRGAGGQQANVRPSSGGGLGDILGQVLGGGTSSGGGLADLLARFQAAGFGEQAGSWVGTGQNQPLPTDALEKVFGRGGLAEIARRAGVSEQDASMGLSQLMPEVVDRVTPGGQVPTTDSLLASVDALARRLGTA